MAENQSTYLHIVVESQINHGKLYTVPLNAAVIKYEKYVIWSHKDIHHITVGRKC